MSMDLLSFLVGSLIVMIAFALGAAVVMFMHHLDHHHKIDEAREKDTVVLRQSTSTPKHAELTAPTYSKRATQDSSRPVIEEYSQPKTPTTPAPTQATTDIPVVPVTTVPVSGPSKGVPVDVVFEDRATSNQRRGGE